ncbi:MAG: hypothetical protein LBS25_05670, partial [Candidatus Symbiothrix sp.]|nr:hypothetical protein [Candidatus Symbiothrix sp.]
MKKTFLFFYILLSGSFASCSQRADKDDTSWDIFGVTKIKDTTQVIEGKHPWRLQGYEEIIVKPIIYAQYKTFEIPQPAKEINISLNTRSENIGKAMLYAKTFDKAMTVIREDSADIRSTTWMKKEFRVSARDADFVAVMMKVEGDTAHLDEGKDFQKMWFDTLRVSLDGKDLQPLIPKGHK